jgi:hypothetical protein
MTQEKIRLKQHYNGEKNWLQWGPYLSERQWGTVREDYSPDGTAWDYFPHDHARSRVYRWGEDGLAGISDEWQNLCFAPAFWNGQDPILKERLFGLTGNEGNHGEDVKELYYYLDNTPTHSYMRHLYKYPHGSFPYESLVQENQRRDKQAPEFELIDTGILEDNRYWDIITEYAKADDDDILIRITAHNRGNDAETLWILPTLWFRNLWQVGLLKEMPSIKTIEKGGVQATHEKLGDYFFYFDATERILFTENEHNSERIWNQPNNAVFVKDSFHTALIGNNLDMFDEKSDGTKFAPLYEIRIAGGDSAL